MYYQWFDARQAQEVLLFSKRRPDRLWGPPSLLFNIFFFNVSHPEVL